MPSELDAAEWIRGSRRRASKWRNTAESTEVDREDERRRASGRTITFATLPPPPRDLPTEVVRDVPAPSSVLGDT